MEWLWLFFNVFISMQQTGLHDHICHGKFWHNKSGHTFDDIDCKLPRLPKYGWKHFLSDPRRSMCLCGTINRHIHFEFAKHQLQYWWRISKHPALKFPRHRITTTDENMSWYRLLLRRWKWGSYRPCCLQLSTKSQLLERVLLSNYSRNLGQCSNFMFGWRNEKVCA